MKTVPPRHSALLVDLYELTMAQCYFRYKQHAHATFDLFVRQMPRNRSFLITAGLEDILQYIRQLHFGSDDIKYLRSLKFFSEAFLEYLADFKFHGDIWAMPEGTVFFPQEPVIRVTAPIMEAQLIEGFLLNTINIQTMIASKAVRCVLAAGGKGLFDFSLRRTHGQDASLKVARSSYLAGFEATSHVQAGYYYGIPLAGTMAHSFVMSFASEIEAFFAYSSTFPQKTVLLVDTYDARKGIRKAVKIGQELAKRGHRLVGIRLDSGNIVALARFARKALDDAGLQYVKIIASGNLDEYKIADILGKGAAVDGFGVGTHMGTSSDAPVLDVIYKLSEVGDNKHSLMPVMKLSTGKVTYPGRKQVFRINDRKGVFVKDILGLEKETPDGQPLLEKVVDRGKVLYVCPALEHIRARVRESLNALPAAIKELRKVQMYAVEISPALRALTVDVSRRLA
ncbi:MAG TPA: nicotinate phosphoribosyltransferase [Candidatus Omnitrophota bacterium]|nr:nicotinate phosphoribosyltransferase [Candidatus Omnitrophota bacterium]HRZ15476.1 nicotinate phosphoribosyltransferase [Candidatus Omnitrophota bacterium]